MKKVNGWLHTGETENGLEIWAKEDTVEDTRYLKMEYRDSEGKRVGQTWDHPVSQVRLMNAILDSLELENGIK
ncbi:hypothetical protein [Paenibacillus donghaensis]|uniref:Transcriptional coactivator p15 (PC4) C-terminal domain-containing protein n=1 Tax=Paenibacillus donghaensis TaxID=414771 RepID=A0A2Z2KB13_9BACL|nr:hypothetical protein [Paenibacillus donghaensis]ASA22707.1 hypothetical protein B9T62_19060 [Paenibacillus donghaensis]